MGGGGLPSISLAACRTCRSVSSSLRTMASACGASTADGMHGIACLPRLAGGEVKQCPKVRSSKHSQRKVRRAASPPGPRHTCRTPGPHWAPTNYV
jgi:hypothetical protein